MPEPDEAPNKALIATQPQRLSHLFQPLFQPLMQPPRLATI